MNYVGIDISKAKFDACLLDENKPSLRVFDNCLEGFNKFLDWLQQSTSGPLHVCMEGTGRLWEPLAEFLDCKNLVVSVVNPSRIKGFADSEMRRSKTDAIDAKIIARFCRANAPIAWIPPAPQVKAIRDLQRHIDALKADRVRETNRLKSGVLQDNVIASIQRHLAFLDSEITSLENQLESEASRSDKFTEDFNLLTTIIGVGKITATTVLAELGSYDKFNTSRELEIFCGIAPRVFKSGSSVQGRTRISKKGNSRIRKALYMAALAGMRHNPTLRLFADRLRNANKPGKVIVCAVMRKLLRIIFAVLKSRKPFDLEHVLVPIPCRQT